MNKKIIIIGMACTFLLISGISYSFAFHREKPKITLTAADDGQEKTETDECLNGSNAQVKSKDEYRGDAYPKDAQREDVQSVDTGIASSANGQFAVTNNAASDLEPEEVEIYAHICGAVVNPGVYQAKVGARVADFIEIAGGLTSDADGDYINQAEIVTDGQRIYIPTKEEVESLDLHDYLQGYRSQGVQTPSEDSVKSQALININEASAEKLMELPGIGQAKANKIIEYRNQHGAFRSTEELMNIPGIKEGLFNQIAAKITVK